LANLRGLILLGVTALQLPQGPFPLYTADKVRQAAGFSLAASALTGSAFFVQPDAAWVGLLQIQADTTAGHLESILLSKATKQQPKTVRVHFANRAWTEEMANKQRGAGLTALNRGAGGGGGAPADNLWAQGTTLGDALTMVENDHPNLGVKQRRRWAIHIVFCGGSSDKAPADSDMLVSDGTGGNVPLPLRHLLMPISTGQTHARRCVTAVQMCACSVLAGLTAVMRLQCPPASAGASTSARRARRVQ